MPEGYVHRVGWLSNPSGGRISTTGGCGSGFGFLAGGGLMTRISIASIMTSRKPPSATVRGDVIEGRNGMDAVRRTD